MERFKKWALFVLPPLILLAEMVVGYDPVSKWLASQFDTDKETVALWGSGLLIVGFLAHHYVQVIRPFKKYERLESVKKNILDVHARAILKRYEQKGFSVRINVMVARRVLVSRKGRKKSCLRRGWSIWTHHLEPFWRSRTMLHDGDVGLVLRAGQGIAGLAYQAGDPKYADLTVLPASDYNLNQSQIDKTSELSFVYSFPVRKFNFDTQRITPEVIGVVNIDSTGVNSQILVNDPGERSKLTRVGEVFSELCSQLL